MNMLLKPQAEENIFIFYSIIITKLFMLIKFLIACTKEQKLSVYSYRIFMLLEQFVVKLHFIDSLEI